MSLCKQVSDKGAVVAWSPCTHLPAAIALATKVRGYNTTRRASLPAPPVRPASGMCAVLCACKRARTCAQRARVGFFLMTAGGWRWRF
ncbi:hypothetical protein EON66_01065 [archaeon]|nr:MAG: hypothetical protein EON66_01065 [archaeon]